MHTLILCDQKSLGEEFKPIKYQNRMFVEKIDLYLFPIYTSLFIQNERI